MISGSLQKGVLADHALQKSSISAKKPYNDWLMQNTFVGHAQILL